VEPQYLHLAQERVQAALLVRNNSHLLDVAVESDAA
jgi:hypothetical protein